MRLLTVFCISSLTLCAVACSSTAKFEVAQPAVQASTLDVSGLPAAFKDKRLTMQCTYAQGSTCVYASVFYDHAATFATATEADRNALAYVLLTTARNNCSWFISRVFANRSGVEGLRDTIKNLMTGAAALTAKPSPAVSAGLGFANLFADSTVKSLDDNSYAKQTFDAIESSIRARRSATEAAILKNLTAKIDKYSVGALLLDVTQLNDDCSLASGIRSLQTTAATQEKDAESLRKSALASLTGVQPPAPVPTPVPVP